MYSLSFFTPQKISIWYFLWWYLAFSITWLSHLLVECDSSLSNFNLIFLVFTKKTNSKNSSKFSVVLGSICFILKANSIFYYICVLSHLTGFGAQSGRWAAILKIRCQRQQAVFKKFLSVVWEVHIKNLEFFYSMLWHLKFGMKILISSKSVKLLKCLKVCFFMWN